MSDNRSDFIGYYEIKNLPQGSDNQLKLNYKEGDPPVTVDLSTYSSKLQVRKGPGLPVIFELSSDDGSIILSATSPNITLFFKKEKTNNIRSFEDLSYDLEITDSSGLTYTILEGPISIKRQITT
jgi:hypothetical protein